MEDIFDAVFLAFGFGTDIGHVTLSKAAWDTFGHKTTATAIINNTLTLASGCTGYLVMGICLANSWALGSRNPVQHFGQKVF